MGYGTTNSFFSALGHFQSHSSSTYLVNMAKAYSENLGPCFILVVCKLEYFPGAWCLSYVSDMSFNMSRLLKKL